MILHWIVAILLLSSGSVNFCSVYMPSIPSSFCSSWRTGDLTNRLSSDTQVLQNALTVRFCWLSLDGSQLPVLVHVHAVVLCCAVQYTWITGCECHVTIVAAGIPYPVRLTLIYWFGFGSGQRFHVVTQCAVDCRIRWLHDGSQLEADACSAVGCAGHCHWGCAVRYVFIKKKRLIDPSTVLRILVLNMRIRSNGVRNAYSLFLYSVVSCPLVLGYCFAFNFNPFCSLDCWYTMHCRGQFLNHLREFKDISWLCSRANRCMEMHCDVLL